MLKRELILFNASLFLRRFAEETITGDDICTEPVGNERGKRKPRISVRSLFHPAVGPSVGR